MLIKSIEQHVDYSLLSLIVIRPRSTQLQITAIGCVYSCQPLQPRMQIHENYLNSLEKGRHGSPLRPRRHIHRNIKELRSNQVGVE